MIHKIKYILWVKDWIFFLLLFETTEKSTVVYCSLFIFNFKPTNIYSYKNVMHKNDEKPTYEHDYIIQSIHCLEIPFKMEKSLTWLVDPINKGSFYRRLCYLYSGGHLFFSVVQFSFFHISVIPNFF